MRRRLLCAARLRYHSHSMSADAPRVGQVIAGRYRVEELSAQGSAPFAARARRMVDDAEVLIFVAPPSVVDPQGVPRYAQHARPLRGLSHPRLMMVLDEGVDATGAPYLVTSFWPRETAEQRLGRQGGVNAHVATALALDVLAALESLHDRELAHRGVCADDVLLVMGEDGALHGHLLAGGVLRVLACGPREDDPVSRASGLAPEQWRGEVGGPEGDVWAVGALLHRLLTGALPFAGADANAVAELACTAEHDRLDGRAPDPLQRVIDRALEKRPEARYPDAGAMRAALEEAVAEAGLAATAAPKLSRPPSVAPSRASLPPGDLDDDLDALIASAKDTTRGGSLAPPAAAAKPASSRPLDIGPPRSARPPVAFSEPPAALGVSAPPAPLSFDLDSMPAPKAPQAPQVAVEIPRAPALPNIPVAPSRPPIGAEPGARPPPETSVPRPTFGREAPRREAPARAAPGAGAALLVVLAVTGVAAYLSRDFLRRMVMPSSAVPVDLEVPPESPPPPRGTDAGASAASVEAGVRAAADVEEAAEPHQPRVENQSPVEFGEQLRVAIPDGLTALQRQQFISHVTTAAIPEAPAVPGFGSCVDGRVFLHPGGVAGALREASASVRCEGVDLALVTDLDGDAHPDVAAIDARRGAILLVGSRRMHVERAIPVANAWGLAAGLTVGEGRRREPAAVVYVAAEGAVPTLVAVGLRSGRTWWRADPAVQVGAPGDYGLAVAGDIDRDGTSDVVAGVLREGRRCVAVLSGATGLMIWRAPRCAQGGGVQYLAAGPDTDEDGRPDIAVAGAAGHRIEVISGSVGADLQSVPQAGLGAERPIGQGLVMIPDVARDGFPDIAVPMSEANTSAVEVYSANDGHRIGAIPVSYDGVALSPSAVRVQYAEGFVFAQSRSILIATPGAVVLYGAAPRDEDRANP